MFAIFRAHVSLMFVWLPMRPMSLEIKCQKVTTHRTAHAHLIWKKCQQQQMGHNWPRFLMPPHIAYTPRVCVCFYGLALNFLPFFVPAFSDWKLLFYFLAMITITFIARGHQNQRKFCFNGNLMISRSCCLEQHRCICVGGAAVQGRFGLKITGLSLADNWAATQIKNIGTNFI